ncbi:reverse transcriptase domain-containing protein [Tanacetum coccineum]
MAGPEPITPLNEGTSNQNSKSIIEGHVSALKELLKEPSNRNLIKPMLLDFDDFHDISDDEVQDNGKGKAKVDEEDLSKPFKEVLKCPFTRRIVEFSSPGHRMPANVKIYDGTGDPEDHVGRFVGIGNQGEWPMPVWCRMFQQTLDGKARAWFDKLPSGSIDNWGSLQEKFLNRFGMLKACDKDPTEISKIARKANETLPHFKERWTKVNECPIIFPPPILARDLSEEALVVEAEVEGYLVRRVHIDEGASVEIMFEHCFNMLHLSIRSRLVETQTTVSGFSGEQVKLLGKMPKSNYEVHNHLGTFTLQHHLRMSRPKATQGSPFYHSWDDEISNPLGVATVISQTPVVFECRKEEKKQAVEPPKEEKVQDNTNPTD